MTNDPLPPHERTRNVIDQLSSLEEIALRTLELEEPHVVGNIQGCTLTWRSPSRRLVLSMADTPYHTVRRDILLEVRAPGMARTIEVSGVSTDCPVAPRPSDPAGSVRRLLSVLRREADRAAAVDADAEHFRLIGLTLAARERLGLADDVWLVGCGSPLHGSGRLSSAGTGVSSEREEMSAEDVCVVNAGAGADRPPDAPRQRPGTHGAPEAPLLCSFARRSAIIRHDEIDAPVKLRALAAHLGRRAA